MPEFKLKVGIARFPYGGNGGIANEHPSIGNWLGKTIPQMKSDIRISDVRRAEFVDTPITMTRNAAVQWARSEGVDVLLMIDSDQVPDCELGEDLNAEPFWDTSFEYIYSHYHKGPVAIGAPYCGPPPYENCYVFRWECAENDAPDQATKLAFYGREESATLRGIQQCAALPTGMILFDMRVFDLIEPPYFYYEYENQYQCTKASTEDVTCTRDISMIGQAKLGYNPVMCNWNAWAGHCKPKVVRKPRVLTVENINEKHREPLLKGRQAGVSIYDWNDQKATEFADSPDAVRLYAPAATRKPAIELSEVNRRFGGIAGRDREVLQSLVKLLIDRGVAEPQVVELGTMVGESARAMAEVGAIVHTIDNLRGSPHDFSTATYSMYTPEQIMAVRNEVLGSFLGSRVFPLQGDSVESASIWKRPIDMVFIDADHDYEAVKSDILAWMPHVKPGGIVAGHDYAQQFPGVVRAVNELFGVGKFSRDHCVWWYEVPKVTVNRLAPLSYPEYEEDVPEIIANGASH